MDKERIKDGLLNVLEVVIVIAAICFIGWLIGLFYNHVIARPNPTAFFERNEYTAQFNATISDDNGTYLPCIVNYEKEESYHDDIGYYHGRHIKSVILPGEKIIYPEESYGDGYDEDTQAFRYSSEEGNYLITLDYHNDNLFDLDTYLKNSGSYVASKSSDIYHKVTCQYAEQIKEDNMILLDTEYEVAIYGYEPCSKCKGYY